MAVDPEEMISEAQMQENDVLYDEAEDVFNNEYRQMENMECPECKGKDLVYENIGYPDGYKCKDCSINELVEIIADNQ